MAEAKEKGLVEGALSATAFISFLGLSLKLYEPAKWLSRFPSTVQPGLQSNRSWRMRGMTVSFSTLCALYVHSCACGT